jgi:hypothetical protein
VIFSVYTVLISVTGGFDMNDKSKFTDSEGVGVPVLSNGFKCAISDEVIVINFFCSFSKDDETSLSSIVLTKKTAEKLKERLESFLETNDLGDSE